MLSLYLTLHTTANKNRNLLYLGDPLSKCLGCNHEVHLFDVEYVIPPPPPPPPQSSSIIVSADNRSGFWSKEGLSTGGVGHTGNLGKKVCSLHGKKMLSCGYPMDPQTCILLFVHKSVSSYHPMWLLHAAYSVSVNSHTHFINYHLINSYIPYWKS